MQHFALAIRRNMRHIDDMRYAHRKASAIELAGGVDAVLAAMEAESHWSEPVRALETWLERGYFSGHGKQLLFKLANGRKEFLDDSDFVVKEADGTVVEPKNKRVAA